MDLDYTDKVLSEELKLEPRFNKASLLSSNPNDASERHAEESGRHSESSVDFGSVSNL